MRRAAVLFPCVLMLTACQQYQAVEGGSRNVGSFAVTTPAAVWNEVPGAHASGGLPTWTVDGVTLNSLSFVSGVEDGNPLVEADSEARYPVFHADMLPNDIVELVQSTCAKLFDATITAGGELKPLTIAGQPGFEVTFEFVTGDEVIRRAFAGGTVKDGQLQLVLYQAARMHYFQKDLQHARDLIVTARLP
jgi:hypothetical protein